MATLIVRFFQNGREVGRVQGLQKPQILVIFEKYKGTPVLRGSERSLDAAAPPKPVATLGAIDADSWTPDTLREMGFTPVKIEAVISVINDNTVDECVLHLERIQKIAKPDKTLQTLFGMDYDASIARAAIPMTTDDSRSNIASIPSDPAPARGLAPVPVRPIIRGMSNRINQSGTNQHG
jgi:hypothetical protein